MLGHLVRTSTTINNHPEIGPCNMNEEITTRDYVGSHYITVIMSQEL